MLLDVIRTILFPALPDLRLWTNFTVLFRQEAKHLGLLLSKHISPMSTSGLKHICGAVI